MLLLLIELYCDGNQNLLIVFTCPMFYIIVPFKGVFQTSSYTDTSRPENKPIIHILGRILRVFQTEGGFCKKTSYVPI